MKRLGLHLGLLLLWGGMSAHEAHAYVRTKSMQAGILMGWRRPSIRMEMLMQSRPQSMSEELFITATSEAAAAWSAPRIACTRMALSVASLQATSGYVEADRINSVQFRKDFWGRNAKDPKNRLPYPDNALAITSVFADPKSGVIVDTDVELNDTGPQWGDLVANPELLRSSNTHDLQNTLTHEFGHVVGLDHTCNGGGQSNFVNHLGQAVQKCPGPSTVQETTMAAIVVPGDTERRTLSADDELAMCEIYPIKGVDASDGGCTIAPLGSQHKRSAIWLVLAGPVAIVAMRARKPLSPRNRARRAASGGG